MQVCKKKKQASLLGTVELSCRILMASCFQKSDITFTKNTGDVVLQKKLPVPFATGFLKIRISGS